MRTLILVISLLELSVLGTSWKQATAKATVTNGFVTSITVTDGGAGYTNAPGVSISSGQGTGATAVAIVVGDKVSAIKVTSAGIGYGSEPSVVVDSPPRTDVLVLTDNKLTVVPLAMWKVLALNSTNATATFQGQGGRGFVLKKDTNTVVRDRIQMDQSAAFAYVDGARRLVFTARVVNPIPGRTHILSIYQWFSSHQIEVTSERQVFSIEFANSGGHCCGYTTIDFYNGSLTPSEIVQRQYGMLSLRVGTAFPGEAVDGESIEVTDVFVSRGGSDSASPPGTYPAAVYPTILGLISRTTDDSGTTVILANPGSPLGFINAYTGKGMDVLVSFDGTVPRFPISNPLNIETNMTIRALPVIPSYSGKLDQFYFQVTGPFLTSEVTGKGIILRSPYSWTYGQGASRISVEAIPELGWRFVRWEGSTTGQGRTAMIELTGPKFVRAIFAPEEALSVGEIRITGTRLSQNPPAVTFGLIAPTSSSILIQTSDDLKEWVPWLSLTTTQPITILSDPAFARTRQGFYRAGTP